MSTGKEDKNQSSFPYSKQGKIYTIVPI